MKAPRQRNKTEAAKEKKRALRRTGATLVREHQLNIRLSDSEVWMFAGVSDHYGLGGADMVRMVVKRESDRIAAEEEE